MRVTDGVALRASALKGSLTLKRLMDMARPQGVLVSQRPRAGAADGTAPDELHVVFSDRMADALGVGPASAGDAKRMNADNAYWRPAYELYAVAGWGGAVLVCGWAMIGAGAPPGPLWYAIAFAGLRISQRLWSAGAVLRRRTKLAGKPVEVISTADLERKTRPGQVWMGWGFEWRREHRQRLYELEKRDANGLQVLPWLRRGAKPKKGNPLLHGVGIKERDIYVPVEEFAGHMFVPATTGAIKTRLLAMLAVQAIHRQPRESVLVVDPKGDSELRDLIRSECTRAGRAADFAYFHPAQPTESVRLDPLHNWTRTTQVASRIGALVPSEVRQRSLQRVRLAGVLPRRRSVREELAGTPDADHDPPLRRGWRGPAAAPGHRTGAWGSRHRLAKSDRRGRGQTEGAQGPPPPNEGDARGDRCAGDLLQAGQPGLEALGAHGWTDVDVRPQPRTQPRRCSRR